MFTTFTAVMLLVYATFGADRTGDRSAIQSPNAVIRSSKSEGSSLFPVLPEEIESMPIPEARAEESVTVPDTWPSTFEVRDTGVASASDPGVASPQCDGRRIFMYKMPAEFNEELTRTCHNWSGWPNMCEDVTNHGFGILPESDPTGSILQPPSAWYRTDQFTLEVTMHERLKAYPCLTTNPDEASMFYIPFYHTLDLVRNLYSNDIPARDRLGQKFVEWLRNQVPWQRHHGQRHVLVLGRIYWDFCRLTSLDSSWGSNLVTHRELFNVTKLLIERSPWKSDTIGIPYPTSFHPSSEADLRAWQNKVRTHHRRHFVAVAGASRKKSLTGGIRDEVFNQCANSTKCTQLICSYDLCVGKPETIMRMGLESVFCLQPPGDSPTRKGIFDSLQAGCIPVLFNQQQAAQQYLLHLPGNGSEYSVVIPEDDVVLRRYDVMDHLSRIPQSEIARMRENIVQLLPHLLYRDPILTGEYTFKDAFDVAVDGLLERFEAEAGGELHPTS